MSIHETHEIDPEKSRIADTEYDRCGKCGAVAPILLAKPCEGPYPKVEVIDDGDVISIKWLETKGGSIGSSHFPQPLITVDHMDDGRPFQLVLVGPRALELRQAIKDDDEYVKLSMDHDYWHNTALELKAALDNLLDWAEHIEGEGRMRRTEALAQARTAIKATRGE